MYEREFMKHILTLIIIILLNIPLSGQYSSPPATSANRQELKVRVYPNPATDFVRVEWEAGSRKGIHVELFDLVGRKISQKKSDESLNHIQIDMKSFQRSAYLLKVYTENGDYSRTYRIIKH
jgi:ABC-type metal ion transport system substrate-binding protein